MDQWLLQQEKKNNYTEDATSAFDSTTEHKLTVPSGKRWLLLYGGCKRDASGTLVVTLHDSSDKKIGQLHSVGAGTSYATIPNPGDNASLGIAEGGAPMILDGAEYIKFVFGAAQGSGASLSFSVLEFDQ